MSEHYLQLRGAAVIAADQLLDARDLVADLLEVRGMGAVYGPAGTGKSFAVEQALTDHPQPAWCRLGIWAFAADPLWRTAPGTGLTGKR
jgi:hypothetical protein